MRKCTIFIPTSFHDWRRQLDASDGETPDPNPDADFSRAATMDPRGDELCFHYLPVREVLARRERTRREAFNFTPDGVNSISLGPTHVRPFGVRVVILTKSRKIPTRKILPLFFARRSGWVGDGCGGWRGA